MGSNARSGVDSNSSSRDRRGLAAALRAREDLLLVAEGGCSSRTHNKSTADAPVLPNLSGEARARARRLAGRLASRHSD